MDKKDVLHVAYCADENYMIPCLVSIVSLLENNKDIECHVYILAKRISKKNTNKIIKLKGIYNREIEIIKIKDSIFRKFKTTDAYSRAMYYRYLLPYFLRDVERVLYLDCDILIISSLKELIDINIEGKACGVVVDQYSDSGIESERLGINTKYFNSGVLLMNLDYWRKNKIFEKLVGYIKDKNWQLRFPDQDALNVILQNKVESLGYRYNYQSGWITEKKPEMINDNNWRKIIEDGKNPYIVHFCMGMKPWHIEMKNPYKDKYQEYANKYTWIEYKLRSKAEEEKNNLTLYKRLRYSILRRIAPERVL